MKKERSIKSTGLKWLKVMEEGREENRVRSPGGEEGKGGVTVDARERGDEGKEGSRRGRMGRRKEWEEIGRGRRKD